MHSTLLVSVSSDDASYPLLGWRVLVMAFNIVYV